MQSTSSVSGLSSVEEFCRSRFRKTLRQGQLRSLELIADKRRSSANLKLPTGYGKTFVANGAYSILREQNRVNRMLILFPTESQHEQYILNAASDLADVGLGDQLIADLRFLSASRAIRSHRRNERTIYATTIQWLIQAGNFSLISELLEIGSWFIVVDEYHHYGIDKTWGAKVKDLPRQFLLAMSATPYRRKVKGKNGVLEHDSAFGVPDFIVKYGEAVEEDAVKPLRGHAYHYRIDLIDEDNEVVSYTPKELIDEAGGDSQDKIRKITSKMRVSPKYISPLVAEPLQRMLRDRLARNPYLQAIIGAMWVDHAKAVCNQVQAMFPELSVDWVGTGPDGRKDNKRILEAFCPPKDPTTGRRPEPKLDVLVHVGIAGEGLDSTYVSEIVHLNAAGLNNQNNQENGRASRYLPGVIGNINFDMCSGYEPFTGSAIMDAMDNLPPDPKPTNTQGENSDPDSTIPEEPMLNIHNIELDHIDSGHPDVQPMKRILVNLVAEYTEDDLEDPESSIHEAAAKEYMRFREDEAKKHNDRANEVLWRKHIQEALGVLAGRVIKTKKANGATIERTTAGDIKRLIQRRKKIALGGVEDADLLGLKEHYQWIRDLEQQIIREGLPTWLL